MADIKTVGIVGAGQMGAGIAHVSAVAGYDVLFHDISPDRIEAGRAAVARNLGRQVAKGIVTQEAMDAALARIRPAETVEAVAKADLVIEAATENEETKKAIFRSLAPHVGPETLLASNTSSISITRLASVTAHPEKFIGLHFMNPVPIMKLVEVIKGLGTSKETTERTIALATAMGKSPLPANDRPGFVSNRVLMPMINEAFYAWMEGVAEPADIDGIMKLGCNFPMGPLNLADFIGLDTCVHIMDVLAEGLNNDRYRACPLLKQLVTAGRLGVKSGRGVFEYQK